MHLLPKGTAFMRKGSSAAFSVVALLTVSHFTSPSSSGPVIVLAEETEATAPMEYYAPAESTISIDVPASAETIATATTSNADSVPSGHSPPDDIETVLWKGYYRTVSNALPLVKAHGEATDVATGMLLDLSNLALSSASDNDNVDNAPQQLNELSETISLLRHHVSDPAFIASIPEQFQATFSTLKNQMSSAEKQIGDIIEIVSEYFTESSGKTESNTKSTSSSSSTSGPVIGTLKGDDSPTSKQRRLESKEGIDSQPSSSSNTNYFYNSGAEKFDYMSRARSPASRKIYGSHTGHLHQQGHLNSRKEREEGKIRRRLSCDEDDDDSDNKKECVNVNLEERKAEQCFRLANCAQNYNLYDTFVFFFGDDIDFDTGVVDDSVITYDESDLMQKLTRIRDGGRELLQKFDTSSGIRIAPGNETILDEGGDCDTLLQEFHRFDEDISVKGKWQGGTVTGICRGWGTTNYISLDSIYEISDKYLATTSELVEECLIGLVQDFNGDRDSFTIPNKPCENETESLEDDVRNVVMNDINKKFNCLYNSYLRSTNGTTGDPAACIGMWPFNPTFRGTASYFGLFNYDFPVVLPSREERRNNIFGGFSFLSYSARRTGYFRIDLLRGIDDRGPNRFIVDVFEEFMGCANDISKHILEPKDTNGTNLFQNYTLFEDTTKTNPYAPTNPNQLSFPIRISEGGTDQYGQLISSYLDDIFEYEDIGSPDDGQSLLPVDSSFSDDLKDYVIDAFTLSQRITDFLEDNDDLEWLKRLFTWARVDRGLDRSALDVSIALLFGNKTTVGQVCAYAKGLKDKTVDSLPGFCCLDAPYQSDFWGELYECEEYYEEKGFTKIRGKSEADCKKLAPLTAGFNEAACDIFSGTWCPIPRDCRTLRNCVNDLKSEIGKNGDRQAFFEYLNDAPEIRDESASNPQECGDFREYFEYDRDFPDDERICNEVADLQCLTDFSNLDGFATGASGGDDELEELAVSTTLRTITTAPFDSAAAKAWRSSNFALRKVIQGLEFARSNVESAGRLCINLVSFVAGTASPCTVPLKIAGIAVETIFFATHQALDISERIYSELVDKKANPAYVADIRMSIYENVITSFGNINTVFAATQQLRVLLGNLGEDLAELAENDEDGRRLETACGIDDNCSKGDCDCDDPSRFCDCSLNFHYISGLRGAGCNGLDSDGDGCADNCEDRFPPELMTVNADTFRCDENDTSRLCLSDRVFQTDKRARNFLESQFGPADDCQSPDKLGVQIESTGTCETLYTLTPYQNLTRCDGADPKGFYNITFENPLYGTAKNVTLRVDEEDPVVKCGFHDIDHINVVENQTLFYYARDEDPDDLKDSNFFYNITDNCLGDISVRIKVESNEYEHSEMTSIVRARADDFTVDQGLFFFRPTSCKRKSTKSSKDSAHTCRRDPNISENIRVYEITVTAADAGGRTGTDTCKVVIVPKCKEQTKSKSSKSDATSENCENFHYHHYNENHGMHDDHGHDRYSDYKDFHVSGDYYKLDYVSSVVEKSVQRHDLETFRLDWDSTLKPPSPQFYNASDFFTVYDSDEEDEDDEEDENDVNEDNANQTSVGDNVKPAVSSAVVSGSSIHTLVILIPSVVFFFSWTI